MMTKTMQMAAAVALLLAAGPQEAMRPEVPEAIKAPAGEEVVLVGHAVGAQIYSCQAGADQKFGWTLKAPEAELSDNAGKAVIHHSAGPTWRHTDGSEIKGKLASKVDSPTPGAIPWLLLAVTEHSGTGVLSKVTTIQRIHTEGGLAPKPETCDAAASGKESRSAYSADYYFFAPSAK
jgi:hypothetical protein